ncbi:glycosyltransferase [Heterostelium album PN500]|uniref:protein O-GlcNAc transferase n=1 Tax=Heterostelium pallidum (strain ATCC 26659 / Pp 5 / PN500) TaxID=670386 RepID=D3BCR2_HETP5|nr:glycosyltransferase [Heterostelium album PN500]EFA80704.1 glycosyltransferase [Heterostelium album PN500]|eukprot:XP_020432824.1 glycosyltransferase [Heterostelium album PN500]
MNNNIVEEKINNILTVTTNATNESSTIRVICFNGSRIVRIIAPKHIEDAYKLNEWKSFKTSLNNNNNNNNNILNSAILQLLLSVGLSSELPEWIELPTIYSQCSISPESYVVEVATDLRTLVKQQTDESYLIYHLALLLNDRYAPAHFHLGVVSYERGERLLALSHYANALDLRPNYPEALCNVGVIHKNNGDLDGAIEFYQRALKYNANYQLVKFNMSVALCDLGTRYKVAGDLERATESDEGKIDEAIEAYDKSILYTPNSINAPHNKLLALNYSNRTLLSIFKSHKRWGKNYIKKDKLIQNYKTELKEKDKLTIGYISPDFFTHSVSYFIDGILKHHDRNLFNIYCYSNVIKEDDTTIRLKSYNHCWRSIVGKSDVVVAQMIVDDCVDILVDLAGHTCSNRLDVVALKPAPITISYLGYPNTTGLPNIDYKFTDSYTDPVGSTVQQYTEQLYRLDSCFLTYTPPQHCLAAEPSVLPPSEQNGYITYGTCNVVSKYSDQVLECWSKLMRSVPNCRLLLKSKSFTCPTTCASFLERLQHFGIEVARTTLLALLPSQEDHLKIYNQIDVALDTFPYAGTTTTCEAIWMGVPVVTLVGSSHSHNVGQSILSNIASDLPIKNLITESQEEYIETAIKLANDRELLRLYRSSLRQTMLNSNICDNAKFTNNLEKAYKDIWNNKFRN